MVCHVTENFHKKRGMKGLLSAILVAFSLFCGVKGQAKCVGADYDNYFGGSGGSGALYCGCEYHDANGEPIFNVSLQFIDFKYGCRIHE